MARWLFKEEPTHYSYADLERDGRTLWTDVSNALARKHLRQVQPGDKVLYYHTGDEKAVVGIMEAVSGPQPDPNDDDPKAVAVEVRPMKRLKNPVSLAVIKNDPVFADWELVRISRLSVMPVSVQQWQRIEEISRRKVEGGKQ
jgi:predicted RNA-binding protein with PUA-like domain